MDDRAGPSLALAGDEELGGLLEGDVDVGCGGVVVGGGEAGDDPPGPRWEAPEDPDGAARDP
ncbi:MAG: hypothetical protein ACRD0L_16990, partial [Acidimicrobiales bacterium]